MKLLAGDLFEVIMKDYLDKLMAIQYEDYNCKIDEQSLVLNRDYIENIEFKS